MSEDKVWNGSGGGVGITTSVIMDIAANTSEINAIVLGTRDDTGVCSDWASQWAMEPPVFIITTTATSPYV